MRTPSITQDNGALGILAAVRYFSNIPQPDRPRTLALNLDARHYITGMEAAFSDVIWFERHPEICRLVVAPRPVFVKRERLFFHVVGHVVDDIAGIERQ